MKKIILFLIICLVVWLSYLTCIFADSGIVGKIGTNDIRANAITIEKLSVSLQATISQTTTSDTDIAFGVTAYGWGDHSIAGYFLNSNVDTDSTFTANSDSKIPSQKAVKSALALKQNIITNPITGTGTAGKYPIFTGANIIGDGGTTDTTLRNAAIEFIIDGGGSAITTGRKGVLEVPFDCTILSDACYADTIGSITVLIQRSAAGAYPPSLTDTSLYGTDPPKIVASNTSVDTGLSGWGNTTLTAGDVLQYSVSADTTITNVTVVLRVRKR